MEPVATNESLSAAEEPEPKSFFSRLGGVYASPRETLSEIGLAPRVLVPLVAVLIIGLLFGFYLSRHLDLESVMESQLQNAVQQGRITQQQMEQQLAISSKFAGVWLILSTTIVSLISMFVIAGYAKLFSIFSGAENKFKPLLSVTIYVLLAVSIVQYGLMVLILQLKGSGEVDLAHVNRIVASSLGALLASIMGEDALPKFVMGLANAVDAFAIWRIVLLAIGYSVVSKKLKIGTSAFWLGIAYLVIAVVSALVTSMFNLSGTT